MAVSGKLMAVIAVTVLAVTGTAVAFAMLGSDDPSDRHSVEYEIGSRVEFEYYADFDTMEYTSVPGTLTFDYLLYEESRGYLIGRTFNGVRDTYWTSDNEDRVWTLDSDTATIDTLHYGQQECEVWSSRTMNGSEIQYIGVNDDNVYRIDITETTSTFLGSTGSNFATPTLALKPRLYAVTTPSYPPQLSG